jgi:uncharacterized protein YdaU (DUF1376 family)
MNFYPFHIGDFKSHTDHLTPKEDICYRRLLDHYYLHESPIANDMPAVARHIKMRDSEEVIKAILTEFFELRGEYWHSNRADKEIAAYASKSEKAKKSIACRWANTNVLRTNNERNTSLVYEGITTNTITNTNTNIVKAKTTRKKRETFTPPTAEQVDEYAKSIGFELDHEGFVTYYIAQGWKLSNGVAMKDWQATVQNWKRREAQKLSIPTNTSFVKEV